jgi:hypothetical protein
MRNLICRTGLGLVCALFATAMHLIGAATAQDNYPPPVTPESAKLVLMEELMRNEKTRLFLVAPPEHTQEQRDSCQQFLADFGAGGAVTLVEPVARADRYSDSAFSFWQNKCPALAMNGSLGPAPATLYQDHPQLPFHMPDGRLLEGYLFGTRNFKLYVVDIDNNPKNDKEVVFYSERAYSYWEAILKVPGFSMALPTIDRNWNTVMPPEKVPPMSTYWGSNYKMLRSPACFADDLLHPEDPYDYSNSQPEANYNGILEYKGKFYLFSWEAALRRDVREFRLFEVTRYGNGTPDVELVCTYR